MMELSRISGQVLQLFEYQMETWPLSAKNYTDLKQAKLKEIQFDDFKIKVQYNPARIISSSANIEKKVIENRPCFLCNSNRPVEQKAVEFKNEYHILINPYPIFPKHLTITHKEHVPQLIEGRLSDMLELAGALPDYTIFYNGPRSGASAPDHFHFQAGSRNYMPLDHELDQVKTSYGKLLQENDCKLWRINDGLRNFYLIESSNQTALTAHTSLLLTRIKTIKPTENEADVNIHCLFDKNKWRILLFPRAEHRPRQYYAAGKDHLLFSPASVDLGGLIITPLEKDFKKMDKELLIDMMKQVMFDEKTFFNQ